LTSLLDNRAKAAVALLSEVRSDLLRLSIPLVASATLLIGLFGGMGIQSWRDWLPTAPTPASTVAQPVLLPEPEQNFATPASPKRQRHSQAKAKPVQRMSDRTTFNRSCEVFAPKTPLSLVITPILWL
jgi:hypothetical protein